MIDGKFAPLTIMSNEHTDLDSMITTFNTAVTETANEILGKHCQKKKTWITAEILDLCDKRRELRKKRFEPEGSQGSENNIKRWMKKGKEHWTEEQSSEREENLRKNNSKRAYQLSKDLTTVKQGKTTSVQDRSGKCLTEERQTLNRWTEYCSELYNYKANGDPSVLNCPQTDTEDDHPIIRKEVKAAVQSLKKGKSAGVDIPAKLVQASREVIITALTTIYRATSHTSRPSKLVLKIILNRLKPKAEIVAEEQAGFRAGMSTTEQIFILRIICEKYFQHQ